MESDEDRETTIRGGESDAKLARKSPVHQIAHFTILETLGAGGMGTVYKARDAHLDRTVALKVMAPHLSSSEAVLRRFLQEAGISGNLDHPNLAKVFDRGVTDGLAWYSMEWIDGRPISAVIESMHRARRDDELGLEFGSKRYVDWVLEQTLATAQGLAHAHQQSVVHRDVKPLNMLLDRKHGTIKLIDFGLAVATDVTRYTQQGEVFGTIAYMAPEQLQGKADQIGPWSDVYSLGVTLFELLTLQLPFEGANQQAYAHSVLTQEARSARSVVRTISRDLQVVIRKALEKEPRDRYRDAAQFAVDLANVLEYRPIEARPISSIGRIWRWTRRKPMHAALVGVLLAGVPSVTLLGWRAASQSAVLQQQVQQDRWRELTWLASQPSRQAEAYAKIDALLHDDPHNTDALRLRAITGVLLADRETGQAREKRARKAFDDIERLIAALPSENWPRRLQAHARDQLSGAGMNTGSAAVATVPGPPTESDLFFDALLASQHDKPRAVQLMSQLIAGNPRAQQYTLWRAYWSTELGRFADAEVDYRVAAALDPQNPYAVLGLGRLLTKTRCFSEAEHAYRRAQSIAPRSGPVLLALADNELARGRSAADVSSARQAFVNAERFSRQALEVDADLPWAHVNLGASLVESARLDETLPSERVAAAIDHYRAGRDLIARTPAADAEGAHAAVLQNLCDAELLAGRIDAALHSCRTAVAEAPDSATAHYNLAGALALSGRSEEALIALERDFELGDRDADYLERDDWFRSLRSSARFRRIVQRMRAEPQP